MSNHAEQNILVQHAAEYSYCKLIHEEAERDWQTMAPHSELRLPHLIHFTQAATTQRKASKEAFTGAFLCHHVQDVG